MHAPANQAASLKAVLGPTNTGKTHYAIDRMLSHRTGMIGLPLRLLAREVYQRIAARVGEAQVALVTGEERIVPANTRYWVATVEAMPVDIPVDFLAVDEIQTATDFDRGHVFTDRILHARGRFETLLLGAATMIPIIRELLPGVEIIERPRLSELTYSGSKKITRQPQRSALIAFSAAEVYVIAELLRRERGGAAVVMGALSPRTRNAQVEMYENGDVDFLVATDAIGMGLNLDVRHVAFAADTKFDGHQHRPLTPAEMGQIAGRAGRHTTNGTFGVTGQASSLDEDMIIQLETHDFQPVKQLQWRNPLLDFSSPDRLRQSLDKTPDDPRLTRNPTVTDQWTLEHLIRNGAAFQATDPTLVSLLWSCCQIPDYRDISMAQHGDIVTRIFNDLANGRPIAEDWIADQVRFCDNMSGDIDTLSNRIKQIRTWTFVANRKDWLDDPTHWRETTRDIENRLSDALHDRLTQRFVDRRTSALLRHLRDRRMADPTINDNGEISLEGHLIGSISGFRFNLAPAEGELDAKALRSAAAAIVAPELRNRAARLAAAPNDQIILSTDGKLRWKGEVVAELAEGDDLFAPRVIVLADEGLTGPDLEKVQDRLQLWLRHMINTQLEQIKALLEPVEIEGAARGVCFQLAEHLGILPRQQVANEIKGLDQDVRGKMRRLGVKFGAYHIYVPQSLKPAPRELALILYALKNGGVDQPGLTDIPHIVLSGRTSFETDPAVAKQLYEIAGFKVAGRRAVRVDILERLADIIRPLIAADPARAEGEVPEGAAERNGFRVTVEMTSLLGCAGEDFNSILQSLGYRVDRRKLDNSPATEPDATLPADPVEASDLKDAAKLDGIETHAGTDPQSGAVENLVKLDGPSPVELGATQSPEEPAEPLFDEVWFPAPRHRENHGRKPQRGNQNANGHAKGKHAGHKANSEHKKGGKPPHANRSRPENKPREKPIDPDSPFAALAVLKERAGR